MPAILQWKQSLSCVNSLVQTGQIAELLFVVNVKVPTQTIAILSVLKNDLFELSSRAEPLIEHCCPLGEPEPPVVLVWVYRDSILSTITI